MVKAYCTQIQAIGRWKLWLCMAQIIIRQIFWPWFYYSGSSNCRDLAKPHVSSPKICGNISSVFRINAPERRMAMVSGTVPWRFARSPDTGNVPIAAWCIGENDPSTRSYSGWLEKRTSATKYLTYVWQWLVSASTPQVWRMRHTCLDKEKVHSKIQ